jgi:4a-hydroxytetrahydrobiopterin dehydratase
MSDLQQRHCVPCEGGIPALDRNQAQALLNQIDSGWELSEDGLQIARTFRFKSYYKTISFVNAVAWIANNEDHHPDMEVGYRCDTQLTRSRDCLTMTLSARRKSTPWPASAM